MNKLLNILTIVLQIGITMISMFILYMIIALTDFKGGFDGIIGITIFQPIMAIIFSLTTIIICGLIGLPIRIHKKLNKWWRINFYISPILIFIGLLLILLSFLPTLTQQVEYEINGIVETIKAPNVYLGVGGWFTIAFGLLHFFLPYKLQSKLEFWLSNKKEKITSTSKVSE